MVSDIWINTHVVIPGGELSESFVRSTGPGGQKVNKVATKVELRWKFVDSEALSEHQRQRIDTRLRSRITDAGELIVTCDEHRTQSRNRAEARSKLASLVKGALVRPPRRRATKPTRASVTRRLDGKKRRSQVKKNRSSWK